MTDIAKLTKTAKGFECSSANGHCQAHDAKAFLAGVEHERAKVKGLMQAGNSLADITECFCDDPDFLGKCETCLLLEEVAAYTESIANDTESQPEDKGEGR